jgi:hypothetical protein
VKWCTAQENREDKRDRRDPEAKLVRIYVAKHEGFATNEAAQRAGNEVERRSPDPIDAASQQGGMYGLPFAEQSCERCNGKFRANDPGHLDIGDEAD